VTRAWKNLKQTEKKNYGKINGKSNDENSRRNENIFTKSVATVVEGGQYEDEYEFEGAA